ncbi:hypothetical protein MMC27_007546 [Xylographa pallens]|nr:hypothetical protein [Xylographa pallens]
MAPWFRQGLNGNQHGFQGHHARASMGDAAPKTAHRTASTFGGGHGGFINIARIYGYNDGQGNLTFPTRRAKLFPGDLVAVSNAAGLANGPRSGSAITAKTRMATVAVRPTADHHEVIMAATLIA